MAKKFDVPASATRTTTSAAGSSKVQSGAEAMTLDDDVFCVKRPTVDTYVHELVHVKQYGDVGPAKFLENYFGEAAYEAIRALLAREDIDPFSASSYEKEGYALEQRFKAWRRAKKLDEDGAPIKDP
jgi:hypothetical protein